MTEHGQVVVHADGSFTYTPGANYYGPDSFTYTATDGSQNTQETLVSIDVLPEGDAPVAAADSFSTLEDSPASRGVRANDTDPDFDVLAIVAVNGMDAGVGQLVPTQFGRVIVNANGTLNHTPGIASETNADSFTYTVSDGNGGTATATVSITIHQYQAVSVAHGVLRVDGTEAADTIRVSGGSLIVNGTAHSLAGVTEVRIWGRAGHDNINLSGSNIKSYVHGGQGNDQIVGGSADDVIFGGDDDDTITGESGQDFLIGGNGKDRIVGSAGHDILVSGEIAFWLSLGDLREIGRAWKDVRTVRQQAADDFIDEIYGHTDSDMLTGGSGADPCIIRSCDRITDFKLDKSKTNNDGDLVIVIVT